jgi:hypothetical protein
MELTIMPSIVLAASLASQDFGLGSWELIIILIIALIFLGVKRLSDLKGMAESMRNFRSGIAPEQRHQSSDSRLSVFIALILFAAVIILSVRKLDVFSGEQAVVLSVVLLGWIAVGYWSFGRYLRKEDGR